ncbi:MAG: hypothetical protein AB1489_07630 [Acidobacteriota bacterium]
MVSDENSNDLATHTVAQFDLNTSSELRIELHKNGGSNTILLQIYRKLANGEVIIAEDAIELPIALLPELKRSIIALENAVKNSAQPVNTPSGQNGVQAKKKVTVFAHESEREFAKILDFYQIEWHYEPRTFALRWDEQGNVIESFTPDFYLPEQDQYIELTTLKQELVTKKNRKVRLLKTLYPEVNIKIMYGKDYKQLLAKYAAKIDKKEDGPK